MLNHHGIHHRRRSCLACTLSSSNSSSLITIVLATTVGQVIFFEQNSQLARKNQKLVESVGKKKSKARDNDDSLRLVHVVGFRRSSSQAHRKVLELRRSASDVLAMRIQLQS
uniref:Uncharacterized protein n=1 Tax=Cucumis melo TaxID=3656 RepID=A0A9I9EE01_CUCME